MDDGQTNQKIQSFKRSKEDLTRPHHIPGSCRLYMGITTAQTCCVQPLEKHTTRAQLSCKLYDKLMIIDDNQSSF